jgi:hypothetical protein
MIRLQIIDGSLQISNGAIIILVAPKNLCAIDVLALYDAIPTILIYNKYLGNSTNIFSQPLANCENSVGTPFTINSFIAFAEENLGFENSGGSQNVNLQDVTDNGDTTTNPITADSFIKDGGTSSQILMADGSIITAGDNITINNGEISSVGGSSGGNSITYYLNGGTESNVASYYQMSNTVVIGTGVNFTLDGNGLITQWLTDVGNPNRLEIPSGAWNFEIYMSASNNSGNPAFYVELLKYNGSTFTTISDNSANPEFITNGTEIDLYLTSIAVPQTTLLATDRLALRIYIVGNTAGRVITMHTQDSTICEVITNFAGGITALNGLTATTQNFATTTSGTDFSISSSGSTHSFNMPSASETARGLITTGSQTLAGVKTFSSSPLSVTPTASSNDTKLATTEYVDRQVTTGANILITTSSNITNQTTGTSNGVSYSQNGRNVMINNGATPITFTANIANTPTDFIASYTKLGVSSATITFTFVGFIIVFPNGNLLSGNPGSTALLIRNEGTIYLLINNV